MSYVWPGSWRSGLVTGDASVRLESARKFTLCTPEPSVNRRTSPWCASKSFGENLFTPFSSVVISMTITLPPSFGVSGAPVAAGRRRSLVGVSGVFLLLAATAGDEQRECRRVMTPSFMVFISVSNGFSFNRMLQLSPPSAPSAIRLLEVPSLERAQSE